MTTRGDAVAGARAVATAALLALLGAGCGDGAGPAVGDPADVVVATLTTALTRRSRAPTTTAEKADIMSPAVM